MCGSETDLTASPARPLLRTRLDSGMYAYSGHAPVMMCDRGVRGVGLVAASAKLVLGLCRTVLGVQYRPEMHVRMTTGGINPYSSVVRHGDLTFAFTTNHSSRVFRPPALVAAAEG
jgi:hypothetical protein